MQAKEIITYLETLKENNTREWFNENKKWYEQVKKDFEAFTAKLILEFGKIDKDIVYLEPKDCIFRIYRDTRFSPDKTPYKTNMGAYLVKGGKKSTCGGYYFHIEPGNYMIAGGVYMPMPDVLKKIRTEIYNNTDEFLSIINNKTFKKLFGELDDEMKTKLAPKDFPKDFEYIDLLKFKSYTVTEPISEKQLTDPKLMEHIISSFTAMMPFIKFLNAGIEQ